MCYIYTININILYISINLNMLYSSKLKKIPTEHDKDDYSFTQIEPNTSPHTDRSSISSVVTRNRTQHRNFADVKKIKYVVLLLLLDLVIVVYKLI